MSTFNNPYFASIVIFKIKLYYYVNIVLIVSWLNRIKKLLTDLKGFYGCSYKYLIFFSIWCININNTDTENNLFTKRVYVYVVKFKSSALRLLNTYVMKASYLTNIMYLSTVLAQTLNISKVISIQCNVNNFKAWVKRISIQTVF